jgi:hypothetical protein
MRLFTILSFAIFFSGCSSKTQQETSMTIYHEDGRSKPIVAIPPLMDTTSFDCPWSLSDEFTNMIFSKLQESGGIFVQKSEELPSNENPFSSDLSWVKRDFQGNEFVVFTELVEHESSPTIRSSEVSSQDVSSNLNMSVRVRVVDLRGHTPKIVLQEMIRDSYFVPRMLFPVDYNKISWGSDEYSLSPMGMAHGQLIREVASRVSDYILLAKSR